MKNDRGRERVAVGLLVVAGLLAYRNSLGGPFVFDDVASILDNPSIKRLWPLTGALAPPTGGYTVSGRPLVNLSLAVNHAISGTEVWSYHALNLLVHLLAGLTLFGLVRRTLQLPGLAERWQARALPVAWFTALLWLVHPLQTEAVTYVIQRAEALMALFYLLTLYAFVRAVETTTDAPKVNRGGGAPAHLPARWQIAAVAACAAGMACKEVMVTAPVVVACFDRTFVGGRLGSVLWRRRGFYAALASTWLLLAALVVSTGGDRGGTFALSRATAADYWLTQAEALVRYLRLAVWPSPLIFEYGVQHGRRWTEVGGELVGVIALLMGTAWAWRRRSPAGFLGVMFLLVLAPTALLPGVLQQIVEHRMYLPLAAVIALIVGSMVAWRERGAVVALAAIAVAAGLMTTRRNAVYADDLRLWADTVAKRPQSALAQSNLAMAYYRRGQLEEARRHNERALAIEPRAAQVQFNQGLVLEKLGQRPEAAAHFAAATGEREIRPEALNRLGQVLIAAGRAGEALAPLTEAAELAAPGAEAARGVALAELGRLEEAVASYRRALLANGNDAKTEANLGAALAGLGRDREAEAHLRQALRDDPRLADAHFNLGVVLASSGRGEEARACYAEAVRLAPAKAEARLNLGIALAQIGRTEEARPHLEAAVRLRPDWAEAQANLGVLLEELGQMEQAREHLREAVRLRPDYPMARAALERLHSRG